MTPDEARAALAAAHRRMTPDEIAAHAVKLAGALATTDKLCRSILQAFHGERRNILTVRDLNRQHRKSEGRKLLEEICENTAADDVVLVEPAVLAAIFSGGN